MAKLLQLLQQLADLPASIFLISVAVAGPLRTQKARQFCDGKATPKTSMPRKRSEVMAWIKGA
jgi:hypothetical protein